MEDDSLGYLNVDYSAEENTAYIDADLQRWKNFDLQILKIFSLKELSIPDFEHGGCITKYDSGNNFIQISKIIFIFEENFSISNLQIKYENSHTLIFIGGEKSYRSLKKSVTSLINHNGAFPVDISYMIEDWGGDELSTDLCEDMAGERTISFLRLFRWK